jgi:EAL domain-containing protein (putative c-di-GMP-specific phosphodiesterase class I)
MPSSTTTIATRGISLLAPAETRSPPGDDGGPILAGRIRSGAFSSPAGLHRWPWLQRLRRALEEDLFVLHYQPIVALQGARGGGEGPASHYEALLRLADRPEEGLVAPASFLPAAERHGLIRDIDRMVLGKVAKLLAQPTPAGRGATIAINVSAVSVTDSSMLEHLERCLRSHRVDPSRLMVEVTETAAISDMGRAREFCAGVQRLGCAVALDDFGAGFGSFQYLKHLPFTYLKIDGDFIRGLPASRTDQLVVKALVGVVRGMGRRTIAEFVGDAPTLAMLRSYGVDYAQGFHLGRPQATFPLAA